MTYSSAALLDERAARRRPWLLSALIGGVLLGVADLAWIKLIPGAVASLGNSSAVWAVAAFFLGRWLRTDWRRAAAAGAIALVVATEAYYTAAIVWMHDGVFNLWSSTTIIWMVFGVVAGALFAAAGALSRHLDRWLRTVTVAMPGALFLAEAGTLVRRYFTITGDPGFRAETLQLVVIEAALGVLLVLLLARDSRVRSLGTAVGLGILGFGAMTAVGFGG